MNVDSSNQTQTRLFNFFFLNLYLIFLGFAVATAQTYVGYEGYVFSRPGFFEIIFALTINIALLVILPVRFNTILALIVWFLTLTLFLPILALYIFDKGNLSDTKLQLVLMMFLGLLLLRALGKTKSSKRRFNLISGHSKSKSDSQFQLAVIIMSVTAIALLVVAYGFSKVDISLETLTFRRLSNRYSEGPFPGSAYIYAWISALLAPLNVLCWVKFKKLIFIGSAIVILIMTFSITGAKSDVLTPVLSIVFFYVYNSKRVYPPIILHHAFYFCALLMPTFIAFWFSSPNLFLSTTRRLLLVPARLSTEYFQYVVEFGPTFFKQNRIGQILFGERIPLSMLIGDRISSGDETNSNINALMDGYASLGIFGIVLVATLMAITLRVLQYSCSLLDNRDLISPLAATACTVWLNQSYFTSILSSGLVLFLVFPTIMIIYSRSKRNT